MRIEEKNGRLAVTDFDAFEAYRIACKIEADGIAFYKELRESVKDAQARKAISFLLGEEQKHLSFFDSQLSRLRQEKDDRSEDNDLLSSFEYGIFHPEGLGAGAKERIKDQRGAFSFGVRIENNSIQFYRACKAKISSKDAVKELASIIRQELRHRKLFSELLAKAKEG
jgi:rubrerythrin